MVDLVDVELLRTTAPGGERVNLAPFPGAESCDATLQSQSVA